MFRPVLPDTGLRTRASLLDGYQSSCGRAAAYLAIGKLYAVSRELDYCQLADKEVHLLPIGPAGTSNTGNHAMAVVKVRLW